MYTCINAIKADKRTVGFVLCQEQTNNVQLLSLSSMKKLADKGLVTNVIFGTAGMTPTTKVGQKDIMDVFKEYSQGKHLDSIHFIMNFLIFRQSSSNRKGKIFKEQYFNFEQTFLPFIDAQSIKQNLPSIAIIKANTKAIAQALATTITQQYHIEPTLAYCFALYYISVIGFSATDYNYGVVDFMLEEVFKDINYSLVQDNSLNEIKDIMTSCAKYIGGFNYYRL